MKRLKQHKELFRRLLRVVLPMIILAGIIIGGTSVHIVPIGSNTQIRYATATVNEVLEDHADGTAFAGNQKVLVTVTSGEYKGEHCTLNNANTYQRGALCAPGTGIIVTLQKGTDGTLSGSVYNYDRTGVIWILLALFSLSLILIGGKKGAASLYALLFTFVCILFMYIPLLYVGINGIFSAVLTAATILTGSIYILNGWSAKTACAIVGTTIGVTVSGAVALLFGTAAHLSGFNMQDVESMVYIANNNGLDVANILYAGVLISSLGAVMDVSVSVTAALWEIHGKAPALSARELFASGMRVGRDMMGTMSNTLILAYTGSATGVLLTVFAYQMPYLQTVGYNSIVIEIVSGLCGTLGVILTVPLQAFLTAWILKSGFFTKRKTAGQNKVRKSDNRL